MLKIERQAMIEQELWKHGSVLLPDLSKLLDCSEETIRRDMKELEAVGKLTRTHGGAYLQEKYDKSYSAKLRKSFYQDEKNRMAQQALHYVQENDVIFLDSSTTCLALAEALLEEKVSVTIITNSLLICNLCNENSNNLNLICLGGTFRRRTASFIGYHTTDILSHYHADKAFISCPKITLEQGLSDNHLNEARVREAMLQYAQERILLMDHTKFGPCANILFPGMETANAILTDEKLPPEWEAFARHKNITLDYCTQEPL
ncbi:MAG: DeoR/GlpR family DNA-binding transcription regulator [Oscillibacter sp.]